MSSPHHEDMLLEFYDEEMASMKQSGIASTMTDAALIEHCEWISVVDNIKTIITNNNFFINKYNMAKSLNKLLLQ